MTQETISPLTHEESACLQIAAQGMSMIDMGEHSKWHKPLQSLVRRGFMAAAGGDMHNIVITAAGRAAIEVEEKDSDRELLGAINKGLAQRRDPRYGDVQSLIEDAAQKFARAVEMTIEITGDSRVLAIGQWQNVMTERVNQILDSKRIGGG